MGSPHGSRNLALYPIYVICLNGFFWFPVFFLYLTEMVGLEDALRLEAIYYLAVVAFEVPSGWASDRFGRRFALRAAALSLGLAYVAFYVGESFLALAFAQVLLALGFAFNSGTDTAFHYDSLVQCGRETEYADREEKIARLSFGVVAIAALAGGFLGAVELRLAYLAAAGLMAVGFVVTLAFARPEETSDEVAPRIDRQVAACIRDLRDPALAWLFGASILLTIVIHVPYQLYQPYLSLLDLRPFATDATPIMSGVHAFAAMTVAALVASRSLEITRKFGLRATVLGALLGAIALIAAMALVLHPLIAVLLIGRSGARALLQAPLNAAIVPRIPRQRRASFLSVQSLAGRLAFSMLLIVLSLAVGETTSFSEVATAAAIAAAVSAAVWLALMATGRRPFTTSG